MQSREIVLASYLQNIQTDTPSHVNIRMVHGGGEEDFRRAVGIVCGELEAQFVGHTLCKIIKNMN